MMRDRIFGEKRYDVSEAGSNSVEVAPAVRITVSAGLQLAPVVGASTRITVSASLEVTTTMRVTVAAGI